MAVEAMYPARCPVCSEHIEVGDPIERDPEHEWWVHEECLDRTVYHGIAEAVCPVCFLTACDHTETEKAKAMGEDPPGYSAGVAELGYEGDG